MRSVISIILLFASSLAFAQEQAPKLDTGDTAWIIMATA